MEHNEISRDIEKVTPDRLEDTIKTETEQDTNLVDFDGPDDPYHPLNWPFGKKVATTLIYGLTTMGSTWATSV